MPSAMEESKLKRLMFRAHHMGSNENDILFGGFAEHYLAKLSAEQLARFETLLAENDSDLFNWITDKQDVPAELDHDIMAMLKNYVKNEAAPR
jgi:antitoxin CptB